MNAPAAVRQDTIAARATPPGVSGIAVVRVSGPDAIERTAAVFSRGDALRDARSHTVHHGDILSKEGLPIDDVLVSVFRSPQSYTGEDATEISCHGGTAVTQAVIDRLLEEGIRHAEPGEFTRRAFLNGRMDLAQAEAVADVIHAHSTRAHAASIRQLRGRLSSVVATMREQLVRCATLLELGLDFAEEDVAVSDPAQLRAELAAAAEKIDRMRRTYAAGRVVRDGLSVVLAGPVNAGKSSLLNALLGADRAIVTDHPGTTRDVIEESALLDGELVRLIDTAGLRDAADAVEREGVRRSGERLRQADVACVVIDAADPGTFPAADTAIAGIEAALPDDAALVRVLNKTDIAAPAAVEAAQRRWPGALHVSAVTGDGLPSLETALADAARTRIRRGGDADLLVTSARHADCLRRAAESIATAIRSQDAGRSEEFVALDVRAAIDALGEIIGVVTRDDILGEIFSRFCIGK